MSDGLVMHTPLTATTAGVSNVQGVTSLQRRVNYGILGHIGQEMVISKDMIVFRQYNDKELTLECTMVHKINQNVR